MSFWQCMEAAIPVLVLLEERDRQAAERERELEERTAKLMEEERNRNDAGVGAWSRVKNNSCRKFLKMGKNNFFSCWIFSP